MKDTNLTGVSINWSKSEINSIKIELSRDHHKKVERLSNRIGVDQESIRKKIGEIELKERIERLARGAKKNLKKHRGRRFRKKALDLKKLFHDRL